MRAIVGRGEFVELATVRRFAAYLADQGLRPEAVTNADLGRYADFLRTELVGVQIIAHIRRIVRLWRRAGADPGWPRTALDPTGPTSASQSGVLSLSARVQDEIEALRRWMIGTDGFGPFNPQRDRKPLRPDTVKLRLTCIRLLLGTMWRWAIILSRSPVCGCFCRRRWRRPSCN